MSRMVAAAIGANLKVTGRGRVVATPPRYPPGPSGCNSTRPNNFIAPHPVEPERLLEGVDVAIGDDVGDPALVGDPLRGDLARGPAAGPPFVLDPDPAAARDRLGQA